MSASITLRRCSLLWGRVRRRFGMWCCHAAKSTGREPLLAKALRRLVRYAHATGGVCWLALAGCSASPEPVRSEPAYVPHPSAVWPWPRAEVTELRPGVTHWLDTSPEDGTTLDLIRFDFKTNPKLRLELYDQDEDDETPYDNGALYFERGVGQIVRHLNGEKRGQVVAAWNGLFFAYGVSGGGPGVTAHHIGPVVLNGKVLYNVGNHRWTFGVKNGKFDALYLPSKQDLEGRFDFAAAGAQLLVKSGLPTRIGGEDGPEAAGAIEIVDDMRTSRVSMAWSRDSRYLYLLFVNEPDTENASKLQVKRGEAPTGGWALKDLQRFWVAYGCWGAINSDGGAVAQMTFLKPNGRYEMLPPRLVVGKGRLEFGPDFEGAPAGGTLMTFFVTESDASGEAAAR